MPKRGLIVPVGENRPSCIHGSYARTKGEIDGADREPAARSGEHELDSSASSAFSPGRHSRTAIGEHGKRAVAPDKQSDLLRYGLCERGVDHREFALVCAAVPGKQHTAGD